MPGTARNLQPFCRHREERSDEAMREHRASTGRESGQPPGPLPRLTSLAMQPASRHPPGPRAIPRRLEDQPHDLPPVTDRGPSPHLAPGVRGLSAPGGPPALLPPSRRLRPPEPPRSREASSRSLSPGRDCSASDRTAPLAAGPLAIRQEDGAGVSPRRAARPVTRSLRRDGPRTPGAITGDGPRSVTGGKSSAWPSKRDGIASSPLRGSSQ